MNLVRLGHYYTPGVGADGGTCETALVVAVVKQEPITSIVNLVVWDHLGADAARWNVPESTNPQRTDEVATFHLSSVCPWQR